MGLNHLLLYGGIPVTDQDIVKFLRSSDFLFEREIPVHLPRRRSKWNWSYTILFLVGVTVIAGLV